MAVPALLEDEYVQHCHLFHIVVKEPENIIIAVVLGILHQGQERTEVSADAVLAVAKRPVALRVNAALKTDRSIISVYNDRVANCHHLRRLRLSHAKCLVRRHMQQANKQVVRIFAVDKPFFLHHGQLFEAFG